MDDRSAISRLNYFSGEALLTSDFQCEQDFHRGVRGWYNRSVHAYGIACGLDVTCFRADWTLRFDVSSGMAIDSQGREIILTTRKTVSQVDIKAGVTYFLTIAYGEVFDELSDEGGLLGYKRVLQYPRLEISAMDAEQGTKILLAAVSIRAGDPTAVDLDIQHQRRYVASRLGSLSLITSGYGLTEGNSSDPTTPAPPFINLSAKRDAPGSDPYLEVAATRAVCKGSLSTLVSLGIGTDQPKAGLHIEPVIVKGEGTMITVGKQVTLSKAVYPPLQPGDIIIPSTSDSGAGGTKTSVQPAFGVIAANSEGRSGSSTTSYILEQAFQRDISTGCSFYYQRGPLACFSVAAAGMGNISNRLDVLRVESDGRIGLGIPVDARDGNAATGLALTVNAGGQVGIGLRGPPTQGVLLEVNGQVRIRSLVVDGMVSAQGYEGGGGSMGGQSFAGYWSKTVTGEVDAPIYYDGCVAVGSRISTGGLTVFPGGAINGAGTVACDQQPTVSSRTNVKVLKLTGTGTRFLTEVCANDSLVIGVSGPVEGTIQSIQNDTALTISHPFPLAFSDAEYQIVAGTDGIVTPGVGRISVNGGTAVIGTGTAFTKQKPGDRLVVSRSSSGGAKSTTWVVDEVLNDALLHLRVPREPIEVIANNSPYMIRRALIAGFYPAMDPDGLKLPPAMLVLPVATGSSTSASQNTVAINLSREEIDQRYALQVNGPVQFSSKDSTEAASSQGASRLLSVGPEEKPLLTVSSTGVVAGWNESERTKPALDVKGLLKAGALTADDTITAGSLRIGPETGPLLTVTGSGVVAGWNPEERTQPALDVRGLLKATSLSVVDSVGVETLTATTLGATTLSVSTTVSAGSLAVKQTAAVATGLSSANGLYFQVGSDSNPLMTIEKKLIALNVGMTTRGSVAMFGEIVNYKFSDFSKKFKNPPPTDGFLCIKLPAITIPYTFSCNIQENEAFAGTTLETLCEPFSGDIYVDPASTATNPQSGYGTILSDQYKYPCRNTLTVPVKKGMTLNLSVATPWTPDPSPETMKLLDQHITIAWFPFGSVSVSDASSS